MPSAKCRFTETNVTFLGHVLDHLLQKQKTISTYTWCTHRGHSAKLSDGTRLKTKDWPRSAESEEFRDSISETKVQIERDHKPRVPIFSPKILEDIFSPAIFEVITCINILEFYHNRYRRISRARQCSWRAEVLKTSKSQCELPVAIPLCTVTCGNAMLKLPIWDLL